MRRRDTTRNRWRVALVALLALSAAAALAGCSGSSGNETSRETTPPILGADARVGQVRVDDVYVDAPRGAARGDNAPLRLTLSNDGRRDDALVSVVTPAAKRVGLLVDGRPRATIPLPAGMQRDGESATDALLVSLREPLAPDSSIVVTFRFAQAGTVSLAVAVGG